MMTIDHNGDSARRRIEELLRKADQMRRDLQSMSDSIKPAIMAWLSGLAGPELEPMLSDCKKAVTNLEHPNAEVRAAALYLLITQWGLTEQYREKVEELAFGEEHFSLRQIGINLIPECNDESCLSRFGKRLALLVLDENQVNEIRKDAYRVLIRLRGVTLKDRLGIVRISFPEDVNWDLVKDLLNG
jgi:hypothetical protein